ncbi:MAG: MFS transporter [Mycoplasmatales bacterium]
MKKYSMFVFYYIVGIVSALALSAYPLIYNAKGYNEKMVALLISISFIAVVFQPVIGYITDKFTTTLTMTKIIFVGYIISCFVMFISFKLFIIGLIINTITRSSVIPLIDGYVTQNPELFPFSYAKMRTAMPIGFGTSFIVSLIFINVFGLPISGILVLLGILAIVALIIVFSIKDVQKLNDKKSTKVQENIVVKNDMLAIITLFLFFILYAGAYQISSTYLTTYYTNFGYSGMFMSVLNFLMIIPQIFLMFNYDKLLGKFKKSTIQILALSFGLLQVLIYVLFPHSVLLLVIAIMLSGIQIVLFPASFYPQITKAIKSSYLSTGLTLLVTIQALWIGLYNQGFVAKVYANTNNIKSIYLIMFGTILVSLIPVLIYRFKREK